MNIASFEGFLIWEVETPMFIVTARIPKKRLMAGGMVLACCAVVLVTALLLSAGGVAAVSAEVSGLRKNDDRVAYLNSLGWTVAVEPAKTEELLIPETFDGGYADYLALQQEQGFDLTQYCGRRVKRYTYTVTNYPDRKDVVAVLLIYKNRIVGGQIQSADGTILHGLAVPNEKA